MRLKKENEKSLLIFFMLKYVIKMSKIKNVLEKKLLCYILKKNQKIGKIKYYC